MDSAQPAARAWIGATVMSIAVFAGCWTASVLYWRTSGAAPSDMAIGQLLLGLPAAILLALWLGKKALEKRVDARASQPAGHAAAAAAQGQPALLPAIVAAALRLRGGDSLEELAESLRTNAAPCELDYELTDDAGYPVLSGRVESCDPAPAREVMTAWLAQSGMAGLDFSDEQWRALSMGGAVVAELTQHALVHPLLPDFLAAAPDERSAIALPVLYLQLVLPAEWQARQREAATGWLLHLVAEQGWPEQRLLPAAPDAGFTLVGTLVSSPALALLVACASHVGDDTVFDWSERGILFSGRNPRGQVPGEGAAGVLLADATQAALLAPDGHSTLHGACGGQRALSADARGNINSELLAGLCKQALKESKTEPAAVATVCADADMRPSRIGELMGVASMLLPELDLAARMISVGACCGTAGAVGPLAALALAHHAALAGDGPVLCVSNSDSLYRCALMVRRA
ncbi:MAG: hypothetical protein JWP34_621 [Massilia sp.]|nr:hypothetical protein [Massilia sp.]